MRGWKDIQDRVWACDLCRAQTRVALDIRQQTEAPAQAVKLLLVGIAPPYISGVTGKILALSATNDPDD